MKKTICTKVMMMAMMAVVSMTMLTACGGDDDVAGTDSKNSSSSSASFNYIVPYTPWSATNSQVRSQMESDGWKLEDGDGGDSMSSGLVFSSPTENAVCVFIFTYGKLYSVTLIYVGYSDKNFQYLISETERVYGTSLTKDETELPNMPTYSGNATINGKNCSINILGTKTDPQSMTLQITAF